ncbi:MAG TPA: NAD-dependent epimerase/dehydratase family protein [Woeseiaceae bacterium]|nr:NAD-dependent epimerase/dehydratase family protein [Woeseiaceae bacterium]
MMPAPDYLVVGNGYTGARLLAALPAGRALALSRSAGDTVNGNGVREVDLDRPLAAALPGVAGAVVYTVPPARVPGPDPRLSRFLDALPRAPARFVYFSSTGVYGDCGGRRIDETARTRPTSDRARRRRQAERLLDDWCRTNGTALVVLRVPGIYGPGRLGVERLQRGEAQLAKADAGPGNRLHVDDLVRCALAAVAAHTPAGIYNVGDGDHRSATWFAGAVAELAGLPAPAEVSRREAERSFSPRRLSFLNESRRVDTRRMREVLRVTPVFADPLDGIRASLAARAGCARSSAT